MTFNVKVHKRDVPIDPTLLFQRISIIKKNYNQLEDFFKYELAPYSLSFFNEEGMRKNVKSEFHKFIIQLSEIPTFNDPLYVIDGGFILRKVVWKKDASYYEIFRAIILYITRHYSYDLYVIFDGYEDDNSINNLERLRRLNNNFSIKVEIKDSHHPPFITKYVSTP